MLPLGAPFTPFMPALPRPRHVPVCLLCPVPQVSSVVLSDGSSLPADLVVVGAGARPASSLVR